MKIRLDQKREGGEKSVRAGRGGGTYTRIDHLRRDCLIKPDSTSTNTIQRARFHFGKC